VVRLYGFSPPTLSLGRFQKAKGSCSLELLAADGVTLVRRPTGGHAVLHDRELTYAVMLSREEMGGTIAGARKREVYELIARVLLSGLERLGIRARVNAAQRGDLRNPDCFGSAGEYEIASENGRKLIGSAQMSTRRAVLQHGSIPLGNPGRRVFRYLRVERPFDAQEPSSLNEEAGRGISFEEVREVFAAAFRDGFGAEDSPLREEEDQEARRILAAKYARESWNLAY
jgi:lipoate-protein ligase A